jgi:hypothetical protein
MWKYHKILTTFCVVLGACNNGPSTADDAAGLGGTETDTDEPEGTTDDTSDEEGSTGAESDGDDSTTTGEPDDSDGEDSCEQAQYSFTFEPDTPNVMLVLDKSRSMSNVWDHDLDPNTPEISRWHSLHNVVTFLTAELGDEVNFGAQLFPSADAWLDEPTNQMSCNVTAQPEVPVGPSTGAAIVAAMPAADDFGISGGTPAAAGLDSAITHLNAVDPNTQRAVVLVTDGAPNCNDQEAPGDTLFVYDSDVPSIINNSFTAQQIPVYVVGINILDYMETKPAVNPSDAINDMAIAGGVPAPGPTPYYNAFNEQELADALSQVLGDIECTVTLQQEPDYPENVSVEVGGMFYPQVGDCASETGWVYTSPNGPYNAIQLCGVACDDIQGGNVVDVEYLCPG